ncbi:MAG: amidase family protein [Myxococcota bacterium]
MARSDSLVGLRALGPQADPWTRLPARRVSARPLARSRGSHGAFRRRRGPGLCRAGWARPARSLEPREESAASARSGAASARAGQRIGYDARHAEEGVDPEVVATTRAALEVFRSLGAEIVELALPDVGEALGAWVWLGATEIAEAHAEPFARAPEAYGPELRGMIEQGLAVEARQVARAWQTRLAFARRLEGVFEQVDALLAPVIPGRFAAGTNLMAMDGDPRAATATRFTSPFNLSGSPALTLCGGFDADGGPIGFQLVGRHLEEDRLLALGRAYQSATDWHLMHPDA